MNSTPQPPWRATAGVVRQSLCWLWLVCLSIFMFLGYQVMNDLADRGWVDSGLQRLQAQVVGLTETTQTLQQRPAAATVTDLQDARQALEERIAQLEQALNKHAAVDDLRVLRAQVEQIEARQAAAGAAASAQPPPAKPAAAKTTVAKPVPPSLPFRVVGAELRAGQRSVSVAPSSGGFTPDQLLVLLPGDTVGAWRLQAIEGNTAVFQAGRQTRRVAIP